MKRFAFPLALAFVVVMLFGVPGCGKDSPTGTDQAGAVTEAQAGDAALADGDIAGANAHYKAALAKDPNNAQANVGAAITEMFLVQDDAEIDSIVGSAGGGIPVRHDPNLEFARTGRLLDRLPGGRRDYGPLANARRMGAILLEGADDPPALSTVQRVIKTKVMPKLQYAEECLNRVEQHPDWRYLVPPAVTSEPDSIEIDLGEVYALDVVINDVQGWLGMLVAYNFDGPAESANPESLLAEGTNFGKLHADGALQLANARSNFMNSKTRLDAMIAFINSETDDQSDDIIPAAALAEPGFIDFKAGYDKIYTSMSTAVPVDIQTYTGATTSINIRIGSFFTNAIADLKTVLPAHTFDTNHEPVINDPVTFPNETFNGIFPGMTNATWRTIIGPVNPPPPVVATAPEARTMMLRRLR